MSRAVKGLFVVAVVIATAADRGAVAQTTLTNQLPDSSVDTSRRSATGGGTTVAGRAADGKGRTVYMVIHTESTMTVEELRDKFEEALKASPRCSVQTYGIQPIDHNTYLLLKSTVQNGVIPPSEGDQDELSIEPRKGQDGTWTIDLNADTKYLESVTVRIGPPSGPDEVISIKAEPKGEVNATLRYHSPGVYILKPRVPAGHSVKSATFMVSDEANGGQMAAVPKERAWPDLGRCYLVTLKGVEGDEKELYATLKDEDKIANPVLGLEDASKGSLVVASFKEMLAELIVFKEDAIQLTFPKPGGKNKPKRMWMRFPLTKAEQEALERELDAMVAGDGFKTVPAWIRKNLMKGDRLTPDGSAGWFQLPWNAERQDFETTLPIDTKSWKERLASNREFMGDNAIIVYEFEGEDGSQRIIKQVNGKYYRPYEVAGWLTGLPTAPTAEQ